MSLYPEGDSPNLELVSRIRRMQLVLLASALLALLPVFGLTCALGVLLTSLFYAHAHLWCLARQMQDKCKLPAVIPLATERTPS